MKILFLALLLFFLSATVSFGCTCIDESHKKTFRKAKGIFIGKLVSIDKEKIQSIQQENSSSFHSLTFRIEKKWKGSKSNQISVITNRSNMCSAFEFNEGEKYLFYAYKLKEYKALYVTSDCASSKQLSSKLAQESIKDLNSFWFRLRSRLWIF